MTVMGFDGLQRVTPALPAALVKTFAITSPRRPATCAEVGCAHHLHGWKTIVAAGSDHADLIRSLKGRYAFTEAAKPGGLVEFVFPPGQQCFRASQHTLPREDAERFFERGGDWRGNPRGDSYEHVRADDWADSFANHQDRLKTAIERG